MVSATVLSVLVAPVIYGCVLLLQKRRTQASVELTGLKPL